MTKGQRKMNDYKLVGYDPTPEMVSAAEDAYIPFGDMELAIRMAILAAPAVQVVPVAYAVFTGNGNIRIWSSNPVQAETMRQKYGDQVRPLYAAPQPAEQQPSPHPDDAAVDRFAAAMKAKLNKKRQEGRGGWQSMTAEQLSALLHEHVRKGDPVDVANLAMMLHQNGQRIEQQPEPNVTALVEALQTACDYLPIGSRALEMARIALSEATDKKSLTVAAPERKAEPDAHNRVTVPLYAAPVSLWIPTNLRIPQSTDADFRNQVWAYDPMFREVMMVDYRNIPSGRVYSHWMPTGLEQPEPPKEQSE